jgi:hypothetical protein
MIVQCGACRVDTAGQHEVGCPNRPRDWQGLKAENERLQAVNMRLEGRYCALADHHDEAHEKCAHQMIKR